MKKLMIIFLSIAILLIVPMAYGESVAIEVNERNSTSEWEGWTNISGQQHTVSIGKEVKFRANFTGYGGATGMLIVNSTDLSTNSTTIKIIEGSPYYLNDSVYPLNYTITSTENILITALVVDLSDPIKCRCASSNVIPLPEPLTMALTAIGLLAIIGFIWNRKEKE